jgi:prepilin-type N-terminal cleavage/methylation domain-containing protein
MASTPLAARRRSRQRGFSLLETVMALGIASIALVGFLQLQNDSTERVRAVAAANRLVQIEAAAQSYIVANAPTLLTALNAAPNVPVVIPVVDPVGAAPPTGPYGLPSLQGGGYLPSAFVDMNGYGQTTALLVQYIPGPVSGQLEAMLTTVGGVAIRDTSLGIITGKVGAAGGMVQTNLLPRQIQGAYDGWTIPVAAWTPANAAFAPSPGHAQVYLPLPSAAQGTLSDFLYRYPTGIPEANTMHTDINVNGNNLTNVAGITGAVGGPLGVPTINMQTASLANVTTIGGVQAAPGLPGVLNINTYDGVTGAAVPTIVAVNGTVTAGTIGGVQPPGGGPGNLNVTTLDAASGNPVTTNVVVNGKICLPDPILGTRCVASFTPIATSVPITASGTSISTSGPQDYCTISSVTMSEGAGGGAATDSCSITESASGIWTVQASANAMCTMSCYGLPNNVQAGG